MVYAAARLDSRCVERSLTLRCELFLSLSLSLLATRCKTCETEQQHQAYRLPQFVAQTANWLEGWLAGWLAS